MVVLVCAASNTAIFKLNEKFSKIVRNFPKITIQAIDK